MKKEAQDFLWYICLKITSEEINNPEKKNDIMKKCAYRAYLDLCRTLKFNYLSTWSKKEIEQKKKELSDGFADKITTIITEEINEKILNCSPKSSTEFDDIHHDICKNRIIREAQKDFIDDNNKTLCTLEYSRYMPQEIRDRGAESFYYGQAQKWLNMTIKYMWLVGIWDKQLQPLEQFLHVPIDNLILTIVADAGKNDGFKIPKGPLSWSKWNYEDYIGYQNTLRDHILKLEPNKSPLEWENEKWIEASELD